MSGRPLPGSFYAAPTLEVLPQLIGKLLVHDVGGRRTSGLIVEAEAYVGEDDPACHAAPGPTRRNAPLYGPPGHAYVYLNYGLHHLVNAVTEPAGHPAAILIRALEPREGVALMRRRRQAWRRAHGARHPAPDLPEDRLCRGPGNLSVALAIDLRQNRRNLSSGPLRIEDHGIRPPRLDWSARIGISVGVAHEWRCWWAGHPGVSGTRVGTATGDGATD